MSARLAATCHRKELFVVAITTVRRRKRRTHRLSSKLERAGKWKRKARKHKRFSLKRSFRQKAKETHAPPSVLQMVEDLLNRTVGKGRMMTNADRAEWHRLHRLMDSLGMKE
jgi:hypothetical protein